MNLTREITQLLDAAIKAASRDLEGAEAALCDETARGITPSLKRYWQQQIRAATLRVLHLDLVRAAWAKRAR